MTEPATSDPAIRVADSVTRLGPEHVAAVLVAGSHGGVYAASLVAKARVRAVILNDAGVGLERAGIAGLEYLDALGMAAERRPPRSRPIAAPPSSTMRGSASTRRGSPGCPCLTRAASLLPPCARTAPASATDARPGIPGCSALSTRALSRPVGASE